MSIILKGIDMTKVHTQVIAITPNGEVWQINPIGKNERLEAQAIQIPKDHGRIIDEREAIRGWCKGCAFNDGTCGKDETICEDKEMCKYAPTILEAEE